MKVVHKDLKVKEQYIKIYLMKFMNNNYEKLAKLAVNKSLLKEYSNSSNERIVYMNDNTEFQIQLFNPYSYVIGVSFKFNNNSESSQLLVIRPGERIWLDRYLDNESKLLFTTYKVGASQEVKEAIKDNGNLEIKFYKENENNYRITSTSWVSTYTPHPIDVWYTTSDANQSNNIDLYNSSINFCQTEDLTTNVTTNGYSSWTTTIANSIVGSLDSKPQIKSIETGRIDKGSYSNQKFNNVNKDFQSWPFKTEYIKILPLSQKQINSTDLQKRYCHNCGRKLNQKFKYCPYCGTKLD